MRKLHPARICALVLAAAMLFMSVACSNQTVEDNLDLVVSFGQSTISSMQQQLPAGDARFDKAQDWLTKAQRFRDNFAAATTPEAQVQLLPTLTALTDSFTADILPLAKLNPVAVAGIDTSLRFIVRYFQKRMKQAGVVQAHAAHIVAARAGVSLEACAARLDAYLRTPAVAAR